MDFFICAKTALFSLRANWDSSTIPLIKLAVLGDNLNGTESPLTKTSLITWFGFQNQIIFWCKSATIDLLKQQIPQSQIQQTHILAQKKTSWERLPSRVCNIRPVLKWHKVLCCRKRRLHLCTAPHKRRTLSTTQSPRRQRNVNNKVSVESCFPFNATTTCLFNMLIFIQLLSVDNLDL